ncbi:uncharacterized protein RSE6_10963 [Rhynchosporium secalis]|uniref:Uncharacterized protein n=1 Tax=Rhynchosporium secalis TaxID=38038 RepID=A0A1E1MLT3_RHYSE|nr:uncharacterized protein RSE6_10963 [Rhynchosporium secalis]
MAWALGLDGLGLDGAGCVRMVRLGGRDDTSHWMEEACCESLVTIRRACYYLAGRLDPTFWKRVLLSRKRSDVKRSEMRSDHLLMSTEEIRDGLLSVIWRTERSNQDLELAMDYKSWLQHEATNPRTMFTVVSLSSLGDDRPGDDRPSPTIR